MLNQLSIYFVFFLSRSGTLKFPGPLNFFTVSFQFIVVVPLFLKFSILTTCRYKIMKRKVSETSSIRVHIAIYIYIAVTLKFIYDAELVNRSQMEVKQL
jgi:hypothetical protein